MAALVLTCVHEQYPARLVLLIQMSAQSILRFTGPVNTCRIPLESVQGWKESTQQSVRLPLSPKAEEIQADGQTSSSFSLSHK